MGIQCLLHAFPAEMQAVANTVTGTQYTVFPDSTAATNRIQTDRESPGQAFARAVIEVTERLGTRGNTVSLQWTLAHNGVERNGVASG